jgi:hypothetical protein
MIGHVGVAYTPEENRVVFLQHAECVQGHVASLRLVTRGAVVQVCELEFETSEHGSQSLQDSDGRGDDFDADAVARDGGDGVDGFAGGWDGHGGGSFFKLFYLEFGSMANMR